MPAIKKVNDHYYITAPEVTITGNLTVSGAQASVTSTDSVITDKVIVLNNGEASAGITGNAVSGIEVDRGSLANASLVFDEATDRWRLSVDGGTTYLYIVTSANAVQSNEVIDDTTPELGGTLETGSFAINNASSNVSISLANEDNGRSGVYVTNDTVTNAELVTTKQAMLFAYVLG